MKFQSGFSCNSSTSNALPLKWNDKALNIRLGVLNVLYQNISLMNVPYWKLAYLGSDLKPMLELSFPNKVTVQQPWYFKKGK